MSRDRRPFLILPLVAFIAISPLILRGCSCGHDFDFHLINWFEVARQLSHGTLLPHWAFTPAWNAGEPRFVFYPPLSWLFGAALGLVMPWTWTPVAYTWLVLTAAGFALYYTARSYASPNAALVAAAIYLTNPYALYTAYERTAYAELLAAVWLPLAIHAVLRERVSVLSIALPVALLWLSNAPAAVMGCYVMAFIILIRLFLAALSRTSSLPSWLRSASGEAPNAPGDSQSHTSLALTALSGALLGLGLASFYLIPAAYERRFVRIDMAILPGLSPWDNFLFQHTSDPEHDLVLHTASIVAVSLIALTALTLLWIYATSTKTDTRSSTPSGSVTSHLSLLLLILFLTIAVMLTPLSAPLWRHLPEIRFLQFPWRLLAVLAPSMAFALALALPRIHFRANLTSILCATIFVVPCYQAFHQRCYPEDTVPERLAVFRSANPGTDPTDEYTPTTADNDSLSQTNPGYWLATTANSPAPPSAIAAPAPHQLDLSPAAPTVLIFNLRDYPAWRVTLNHAVLTTRLPRKDGLIAIPIPAGPAHIQITYITLPDQQLGYTLTALSFIAIVALLVHKRTRAH